MPLDMKYPGVYRQEKDESLIPAVDNTTVVATIGRAKKGIANSIVLVNSEDQLIKTFGTPICSGSYPVVRDVDYGIYSAIEALKETNNVYYVRATNGTEKYSSVSLPASATTSAGTTSGIAAIASSAYPSDSSYTYGNTPSDIKELNAGLTGVIRFASVGPGVYGNEIAVTITTSAVLSNSALSANYTWGNSYGDSNKSGRVFKVDVYSKQPSESFTSTMVPVETFYGSNSVMDLDNNGNSLYIEDVINGSSMYVYVKASGDDIVPPTTLSENAFVKVSLAGGQDATSTTYVPTGLWDFFNNKQNTPIDLAIVVPRTKEASVSTSEVQKIDSVIGKRLDMFCVVQANALASTSEASIVSDNTNVQGSITNYSYFGKYVGWNLVFDRYNSSRVYLPNAIYAAAVIARTDRISSPWEAPAGQERGVIAAGKQSVILVPDVAGRLYENYNLNTVRFLNGIGNVIWGQKTSQLQKTARDRINVRRMLNYVENGSERILNAFLFRGNTSRERERVYNLVNSFINTVYVAGGVSSYRVVCDNTNNTETTIAQNILNVDIFIQPTYTIEFIKITTTITASSVNVGEG